MINANEAHKIMEKNNTRKNELRDIVGKVIPMLDERIRRVAGFGEAETIVTRDEIMANVKGMFFTKKEILDAVMEELTGYGFNAIAPASYSSIHIKW